MSNPPEQHPADAEGRWTDPTATTEQALEHHVGEQVQPKDPDAIDLYGE